MPASKNHHLLLIFYKVAHGVDSDIPSGAEDEDGPVKKKAKGPSAEEVNQNKIIANLQTLYRCEDRKCSFDFCWLNGQTASHVHLTHLHLRTWSAALVCIDIVLYSSYLASNILTGREGDRCRHGNTPKHEDIRHCIHWQCH